MNKAHRTLWLGFCFYTQLLLASFTVIPPCSTFAAVNTLQFSLIKPASAAYDEMVDLRLKVLLEPISIPRSYIDPGKEAGDILLGAYADGVLVGCCILTTLDEKTVQLRQMAVAVAVQKRGVGRQLLLFAENIANEKGFTRLLLHARNPVLSFYQKCGYTITDEPFFEVGILHHKMQKRLVVGGG